MFPPLIPCPPPPTPFPYTTLFRSVVQALRARCRVRQGRPADEGVLRARQVASPRLQADPQRRLLHRELRGWRRWQREHPDRKSTRLNSSHLVISYAVFCLKKKNRS